MNKKTQITLTAGYEYLRGVIGQLPAVFDTTGKVIHTGRNIIRVMSVEGIVLNVKRYHVPSFINRVVYSFFRMPKGKRAFMYPMTLLEKGFETPFPVAYVEERWFGLIGYSYFVSLQCPYTHKFYEFGDAKLEDCRDVVVAFARYTAALHENGILHYDYSPGNILFEKINNEYHFSIVDINRMKFGSVSLDSGCANFSRLWGQKDFFILLAKTYAQARHADETFCVERILYYRRKFWQKYARRHTVGYRLEL